MMPSLGQKYKDIDIQITSKPVAEYQNDEYFELDMPVAPAVMVADEIVTEGEGISQDRIEDSIRRHLGISGLKKKGIWDWFLK